MRMLLGALRRWWRRVPVRQQLATTDCGAACLAMIASYFGRSTTVAECRAILPAERDGVTIDRLTAAASALGLRGSAGRDVPPGGHPVIAHWCEHHFVVVERVGRRFIRIVDPASGRRRVTPAEFAEHYGRVRLTLGPGPDFVRYAHPPAVVRELVGVPDKTSALLTAGLAAIGILAGVLGPPLAAFFVPVVSGADAVMPLAVIVLAIAAGQGAATALRGRLAAVLRRCADGDLTDRFAVRLLGQPIGFFLLRPPGDLSDRMGSTTYVAGALTAPLTLSVDAVMVAACLGALVAISPAYLAVVLALIGAHVALTALSWRRLQQLDRTAAVATAAVRDGAVETITAIVTLKANGADADALRHWRNRTERRDSVSRRQDRVTTALDGMRTALVTLTPLALCLIGIVRVLGGGFGLAKALAACGLAIAALRPFAAGPPAGAVRSSLERLRDVLDAPGGIPVMRPADRTPVRIDLTAVTAGYSPHRPVLTDVTLTLPPGRKVAVTGPSGSGKTTLALVALGLLAPARGTVRIDGRPITDADRSGCGAVLQDLAITGGTIWENIALGRAGIGEPEIVRAARTADLHEEVTALPMGYHTQVGEGGLALSAGQRQKIAIARAVAHGPRLLVLDEATNHLDPETERRVMAALDRLEITRLVISHRPDVIANADEVLVLDRGRIVDRGRWEQAPRFGVPPGSQAAALR